MTETTDIEEMQAEAVSILKPRAGWIILSGIVTVIFGLLAFWMPVGAVWAMTILFGAYAFADGVLSIITAVRRRHDQGKAAENFWPLLLRGVLGVFAGVIVLVMPGLAVASLTAFIWAMIALWAVATGIMEIMAAVHLRREIKGEWVMLVSGLISLALGLAVPVVLIMNPAAGVITMGWMIGFYALLHGILEIILGRALRKMDKLQAS